jgi:dipeptidyl aminopeptidase/acylaminoacyl peptidase
MLRSLTSFLFIALFTFTGFSQAQNFTFEAIKSYPFPTELIRSNKGNKIAWALEEKGVRNIYVAEGPSFEPRKLTSFTDDDGQEITSISISDDGKWVIFVRGGDHGANFDHLKPINPYGNLEPQTVRVMQIAFTGGPIRIISEGDEPVISPKNDVVAYIKEGQPWICKLDTNKNEDFLEAPVKLFKTRGTVSQLKWSPDGSKVVFVANRGDHAFIGTLTIGNNQIQWIDPSFARDLSPRWSPDGKNIVFIRTLALGGQADSLTQRKKISWSIRTASLDGVDSKMVWDAPKTNRGSLPPTHGGANLFWATDNVITFTSYHDGWPHLYSIAPSGGKPLLLTPGEFMVEHVSLSLDWKSLLCDANTGPDALDKDRRHILQVPVDRAEMKVLTPGNGNEWTALALENNQGIVYIGSTPQKAPQVIFKSDNAAAKSITSSFFTAEYPEKLLVEPKQVIFKSLDGLPVHAQIFDNSNGSKKKPAIIFVHGGPPRQMLLGWHYSDYYANAYALNQYLANLGFVVLSVNYRLGIGYGYEFQHPKSAGHLGASEYLDIKAAGEWLASQSYVDAKKIGIYGGSYGGYLTALGLARDSKLFAAGVDIHGVHDWANQLKVEPLADEFHRAPDAEWAASLSFRSSPVSSVNTWTSPALIIHADDDRNVSFNQSVDMVNRLLKRKVAIETMVIVDDTHHWLKFSNALKVFNATANYFKAKFLK